MSSNRRCGSGSWLHALQAPCVLRASTAPCPYTPRARARFAPTRRRADAPAAQARCLAAVEGDSDRSRFLVSTLNLRAPNEVSVRTRGSSARRRCPPPARLVRARARALGVRAHHPARAARLSHNRCAAARGRVLRGHERAFAHRRLRSAARDMGPRRVPPARACVEASRRPQRQRRGALCGTHLSARARRGRLGRAPARRRHPARAIARDGAPRAVRGLWRSARPPAARTMDTVRGRLVSSHGAARRALPLAARSGRWCARASAGAARARDARRDRNARARARARCAHARRQARRQPLRRAPRPRRLALQLPEVRTAASSRRAATCTTCTRLHSAPRLARSQRSICAR